MVVSDSCGGVLAGPASRTLAGDHRSGEEQLTAPDPPRLAPFEGPRQALGPDRTVQAQGLGQLDVAGRLVEVELRVVHPPGPLRLVDALLPDSAGAHPGHLLVTNFFLVFE